METKLFLHDNREETTEGVDYLLECPICEQYRHKSWFVAGERGCARCQVIYNSYIDQLALNLIIADRKLPN